MFSQDQRSQMTNRSFLNYCIKGGRFVWVFDVLGWPLVEAGGGTTGAVGLGGLDAPVLAFAGFVSYVFQPVLIARRYVCFPVFIFTCFVFPCEHYGIVGRPPPPPHPTLCGTKRTIPWPHHLIFLFFRHFGTEDF